MGPRFSLFSAAVALVVLFCGAAVASAQVSIYGTFSPIRISNQTNGNTTATYWEPGFGGGVSLTVLPLGPVSVGIDLRGSTRQGARPEPTLPWPESS